MNSGRKLTLDIVICSTRPGRVGEYVAKWFHTTAQAEGSFNTRLIDLHDFALPLYDESRHPRLGQYEHEHTRRWARSVSEADAFAFVAPEYNHGPTPALVNALCYLNAEWAFKPVGFVCYGGRSGGLRGVQATKPILSALQMYPTKNAVVIPSVKSHIKDGIFEANDGLEKEANGLINELGLTVGPLARLRADKA
mgnify:FL=1|tara:strand:- start:294 stop:878 length:585 start_codon:yes stop_codon:yes gene_type:complete